MYLRYIDDIFGIWLHGAEEHRTFHGHANEIHPKLKVDLRTSQENKEFLDVCVRLSEKGILTTDLHVKPTDSKSYLHFGSDHPLHTKKAVPFGLGIRIRRICTSEKDFEVHRDNLKSRLLAREYPEAIVDQELRKVEKVSKDTLLVDRSAKDAEVRVPLAVTFTQNLPNIRHALRNKRHILQKSQRLRDVFLSDSIVAYRRGRNLGDILVHAKTKRATVKERGKIENCGKNCVICRRMFTDADRIVGAQKHCITTYDRTIGCRSVNVVYGIWCGVCRCVCYVGETGGSVYTRTQNHLSSIRANNPAVVLPVRAHFHGPGHSIDDVFVVGLERVWRDSVEYRRVRERRWMNLLGTSGAEGRLNKRYN